MTYQEISEAATPKQIEVMLRVLDRIAECSATDRPGHAAYLSKADMIGMAKMAAYEFNKMKAAK